jgi:8-oxo-dGTP pyrophosphatase MutT (NUDIX family)
MILQRLLEIVAEFEVTVDSHSQSIDPIPQRRYDRDRNKTMLTPVSNKNGDDDRLYDNNHQGYGGGDVGDDDIRGRASVLVLISSDGYVLLTKRSSKLRSHPGQVALPGGKQDPEDGNDHVITALRETYEEVGVDFRDQSGSIVSSGRQEDEFRRKTIHTQSQQASSEDLTQKVEQRGHNNQRLKLHIIGKLSPPVRSINNLLVTAIVACTPNVTASQLEAFISINEEEVSDWFWTPLSYFSPSVTGMPAPSPRQEYDIWWHNRVFTYRHYDYEYNRSMIIHDDHDVDDRSNKDRTEPTTAAENSTASSSCAVTSANGIATRSVSASTNRNMTFAITGLTAHILHELSAMVYYGKNDYDHRVDRELHGHLRRNYEYPNTDGPDDHHLNQQEDRKLQDSSPGRIHQPAHSSRLNQKSKTLDSKKVDHYYVLVPPSRSNKELAASAPAVLHQYDSYQQYISKGQSARKKQRLLIHPNDCTLRNVDVDNYIHSSALSTAIANSDDTTNQVQGQRHNQEQTQQRQQQRQQQYLFQIRTADNRICWTLAAASSAERTAWMERIQEMMKVT